MGGMGLHVCKKCGWSFPNSHPSSKQRRSHKKVCGKLEGFKIIESENDTPHLVVYDGEHQANEIQNMVEVTSIIFKDKSKEEEIANRFLDFVDDGTSLESDKSITQPSNDPSDAIQVQFPGASDNVVAPMVTHKNEDHSLSNDAVDLMIAANTQTSEDTTNLIVVNDKSREEQSAGEISSEPFGEDDSLQKMNGVKSLKNSLVVDSKEEETSSLKLKLSRNEVSPTDTEDSNEKEVNGEDFNEDCKNLKVEPDRVPDVCEAKEAELIQKSYHGDKSAEVTVTAVEILEKNLQQEENGDKKVAQELYVERPSDVSITKDIADKDFASDALEALPDSTTSGLKDHIHDKPSESLLKVPIGGDTREAIDATNGDQSVIFEEARTEHSNITIAGGAMDENSTKPTTESKAVGVFLAESMTESISDSLACEDELKGGSKELEASRNVVFSSTSETEVQVEAIDSDNSITKSLPEVTKLNNSTKVDSTLSYAKNPNIDDSIVSAADNESSLLSSAEVEENNGKSSQSLQEEVGNNCVKQPSETSDITKQDSFVDSISQTDSVDGIWGSISDGTALSVKDAGDVPESDNAARQDAVVTDSKNTKDECEDHRSGTTNILKAPSFMTWAEHGKEGDVKPSSLEIRTVKNQLQEQPSSETGQFPSITEVVNESQGRKKNEEINEKIARWNSGKSRTPLRNLLAEDNLESKQNSKTKNDDDLTAKPVNPTSSVGLEITTKTSEDKEWNSPPKFPVAMSKKRKKSKSWIPFVCCSSTN